MKDVSKEYYKMKRKIYIILFFVLLVFIWTGCTERDSPPAREVVVYTSEDQVFSEPILRDFEKETGIKVRAVFDTEEAKSTGVMNRLIAEKDNPQADVFWANEPFRAQVLKDKGIAAVYHSPQAEGIPELYKDPDGYWTGFSARARVFVVNQSVENFPTSILAYGDPVWHGKGVIANPLFGTTTVQVAALFSHWGEDKAKTFLEA
jgi:iron(III) transport system substrate-binding protein